MILDLAKEIEKNADKVFVHWVLAEYKVSIADLIERTFPHSSVLFKLKVLNECEKKITRRIFNGHFTKNNIPTT
jgi:hypothetical protein